MFHNRDGKWSPGSTIKVQRGIQFSLLSGFANNEGNLTIKEANQIWKNVQCASRNDLLIVAKPAISKINTILRSAFKISGKGKCFVPINLSLRDGGWNSQIAIGYVVKNDDDSHGFKLKSQLTREESVDNNKS